MIHNIYPILEWVTFQEVISYWLQGVKNRGYIDYLPALSCRTFGGDIELAQPVTSFWILSLLAGRIFDDLQDDEGKHHLWHQNNAAIPLSITAMNLADYSLTYIEDSLTLRHILSMTTTATALAAKGQSVRVQELDTYFSSRISSTAMAYGVAAWAGARLVIDDEKTLSLVRDFAFNIGMRDAIRSDCNHLEIDLQQGTYTLPVLHALSQSNHPYHSGLSRLLKNDNEMTLGNLRDVMTIVNDMGAIAWSLSKAQIYHDRAVSILSMLPESQEGLTVYAKSN